MEKQTRVSKYKELRDEMKEEVAINRDMNTASQEEDDDFLAFMPKQEEKKIEDTLIEPLSYETLDQDSEDVVNALREAKVTVGKERYNTRLDILNKIVVMFQHMERKKKVFKKFNKKSQLKKCHY